MIKANVNDTVGQQLSIMQKNHKECYFCKSNRRDLQTYHVFGGDNERRSRNFGLTVTICPSCKFELGKDRKREELLKNDAMMRFLKQNKCSEADFRKVIR